MPTYHLVLIETPPSHHTPNGGLEFGGFFHSEAELDQALRDPLRAQQEGERVIYDLKSKSEGKAPTDITKRRNKVNVETETRVS